MSKIIFIVVGFFLTTTFAKSYDNKKLSDSGVSFKNGTYYCLAMKKYVRPYDNRPDVEACAFATRAKEICEKSPNTRWLSGRCFCPELNNYLGERRQEGDELISMGMNDVDANHNLFLLQQEIKGCDPFIKKDMPFGRSVYLEPFEGSYVVHKKAYSSWDNRDDVPGEQGDPHFGAQVAAVLDLSLGFGYLEGEPVIPTFDTLMHSLRAIKSDVSFYQTQGALSGRQYLENFIANQLPIAKIDENQDATYFLHDINFHAVSFLLMPKEVRELAQRQTRYLLNFIDDFTNKYPRQYETPQFKLLLRKLIESQIELLDLATGNFMQRVYLFSIGEPSLSAFIRKLSLVTAKSRLDFHSLIMALTDEQGYEKRSAKDFIEARKGDFLLGLDKDEATSIRFFQDAIDAYIEEKSAEPDFIREIELAPYRNIAEGQGLSAVDLFKNRLLWLNRQKPGRCILL